jgi:predicted TIM-barrel fold metal-dependent hydrolase
MENKIDKRHTYGIILDTETARMIIDIQGTDKFLFGSDMPWERQSRSVDKLLSFGLSESDADCTIRMSLCKDNTREDIDAFAELLASGINRLVKIKR